MLRLLLVGILGAGVLSAAPATAPAVQPGDPEDVSGAWVVAGGGEGRPTLRARGRAETSVLRRCLPGTTRPPRSVEPSSCAAVCDRGPWWREWLPWRQLAMTRPVGPVDSAGVRMFDVGGRLYDHPVIQSQWGLMTLEAYRRQGLPRLLTTARAQADRQVERHVTSRRAWFFPYRFDFALARRHGFVERAPWYSGMAQGEALSLFSQLAQLPEVEPAARQVYRSAARATFRSLLRRPSRGNPWVSMVDARATWRLQEYPNRKVAASDYTFNGHVFALLGLYDYYRLTGSRLAAALFDGAATTALHYAKVIRRPGGLSSYCVPHNVFREHYHSIHISLLRQLHWLTGDQRFSAWARRFSADSPG